MEIDIILNEFTSPQEAAELGLMVENYGLRGVWSANYGCHGILSLHCHCWRNARHESASVQWPLPR